MQPQTQSLPENNLPELKKRLRVLIQIWKIEDIEDTHKDLFFSISQQIENTGRAIRNLQYGNSLYIIRR